MAYVTYTALRKIISGHSASTSYTIDFGATEMTPILDLKNSYNIALDGTTEGVLDRTDDRWRVRTNHIDSADVDQWKEFFASVAAAESFAFDAYGTSVSPDNEQTVILEGNPTFTRVSTIDKFNISFNVRVI